MEKEIIRVENIKYLNDVKRGQLAFLVSKRRIVLDDNTKFDVIYSRVVKLKADYLKLENARRAKLGLEPIKKEGPLLWGEWEINGVLIFHFGDHYLRYYPYDGELQERNVDIYREDGTQLSMLHPEWDNIYRHWKEQRPKGGVCRVMSIDRIKSLYLLDKNGDPEVDIIYERYKE